MRVRMRDVRQCLLKPQMSVGMRKKGMRRRKLAWQPRRLLRHGVTVRRCTRWRGGLWKTGSQLDWERLQSAVKLSRVDGDGSRGSACGRGCVHGQHRKAIRRVARQRSIINGMRRRRRRRIQEAFHGCPNRRLPLRLRRLLLLRLRLPLLMLMLMLLLLLLLLLLV